MKINLQNLYDAPPPINTRGFFDPNQTRKWIYENVLEGFKNLNNKLNVKDFQLRIKDIKIPEVNKYYTVEEQKKALLDKKDLTIPIKGVVQLVNKTHGKVVDEKRTTLAHLPWLTDRNTFILNGTEYLVANQQRLKPGIYTRLKESGEIEGHINVQQGSGWSGKIIFHADRALFVYELGTTQIKLYGLLRDLGVPDAKIKEAWGEEIYLKNKAMYDGKEIDKFYEKIHKYVQKS